MRDVFAAALILHGLIHLIGPLKAFRPAALPRLPPISAAMGLAWLVSALLFVAAGVGLFVWPRGWWALAVAGVLISQGAIVASWTAAKFGTALNLIVGVGVAFGLSIDGPLSLRAEFEQQVDWRLSRSEPGAVVSDRDLAPLPAPVQHYLKNSGVVGHTRPDNVYVRMHGRIRNGPDAPWQAFTAEQYNFFGDRARLFYMELSEGVLAVQGLHRYVGAVADMRVNVAGLVPVVNAGGEDMTQSETVTMFNDMAVFAPASLLDPSIAWTPVDDCTVSATFENAMMKIDAMLEFNDRGELVNFWSDDRAQVSADGTSFQQRRWSTPLDAYRVFGATTLASHGEARWHEGESSYSYIEIHFDDVRYNVRARVR